MARLFGFNITNSAQEEKKQNPSFIPEQNDDGAVIVQNQGAYGISIDLDGTVKTQAELINKYRNLSHQAEIADAIDNITNEAIVVEKEQPVIKIVLDDLELSPNIKEIITNEFQNIMNLLDFQNAAHDIFKRFYIDGRLNYHCIIDPKVPQAGILELRYIDPRKIQKVREVTKVKDKNGTGVVLTQTKQEYYIYSERGFGKASPGIRQSSNFGAMGVKVAKDAILSINSGYFDEGGSLVLSYLNTSIKAMNQLRALEDATLIYRISRAPERRIFYIDVGNLPKAKAEQYLRDIMAKHKNKLVYDATTGEIRDDRKFTTMLEDYWLPRRGDGKATEITTLPAGQNLGELEDVKYFQRKLFKTLNIPMSRLEEGEGGFSIGRAAEITHDEVNFQKFVDRLRNKFAQIFLKALEKQLILKMIATPEDWDAIKHKIKFEYARDSHWEELKEFEILSNRLEVLNQASMFAGKVFSWMWLRKNILKMTDEEIMAIDAEIAQELMIPQFNPQLLPPPPPIDNGNPSNGQQPM